MDEFSFRITAFQLQNLEASSSVYFMIDPKFLFFLYISLTYDIGLLWKNIQKSILDDSKPKIHFASNNNIWF